jgi:N-acetylgalactosamine kinase
MELGKSQGEAVDSYSTLCQVQQLVGSMEESEKFAADNLHEGAYSKAELEGFGAISLEALFADSAASLLVLKHNTTGFKVRRCRLTLCNPC